MFCPFISTSDKELECKEGCRFRYKDLKTNTCECEINYIADKIANLTEPDAEPELEDRFD